MESKVSTIESKASTIESKASNFESKTSTIESKARNFESKPSNFESKVSNSCVTECSPVCNGLPASEVSIADCERVMPPADEPKEPKASSLPESVPVKPIDMPGVKRELLKSMRCAFSGKTPPDLSSSSASAATCPGPKKKSLELLANNLLQRALAQQKADPAIMGEEGDKTESDPTDAAAAINPPASSLGLCLIANSYVSSGEEDL
jgi:hypothetical protein